MYCPKCGAEQINESNFCHKCGYRMINEEKSNVYDNESNNRAYNHNANSKKDGYVLKHKKILIAILVTCFVLIVVALFLYKYNIKNDVSSSKPTISEENIEDQLKSVINLNVKAMEEEDLDKYLSTVTIADERISQTEESLRKLFKDYDLKYTIEDSKVLTTDKEDAQVQVVQTTKKSQGGDFKDNRMTAIHHLKQSNGKWKIFKTDMKNVEYINEKSSTQNDAEISQNQSFQKSIIGRWTDGGTYQLTLTESTYNGCPYNIIGKVVNNRCVIEVTEKAHKSKYLIVSTGNNSMMLYMYNDETSSYTGGSKLKRG